MAQMLDEYGEHKILNSFSECHKVQAEQFKSEKRLVSTLTFPTLENHRYGYLSYIPCNGKPLKVDFPVSEERKCKLPPNRIQVFSALKSLRHEPENKDMICSFPIKDGSNGRRFACGKRLPLIIRKEAHNSGDLVDSENNKKELSLSNLDGEDLQESINAVPFDYYENDSGNLYHLADYRTEPKKYGRYQYGRNMPDNSAIKETFVQEKSSRSFDLLLFHDSDEKLIETTVSQEIRKLPSSRYHREDANHAIYAADSNFELGKMVLYM